MNELLNIHRFPKSSDQSLKAWSAADEHLIKYVLDDNTDNCKFSIINDRFGYLTLNLYSTVPNIITHFKSQEDAIIKNFESNNLDSGKIKFSNLINSEDKACDRIVLKIPKSLDLFHLFLIKAHKLCKADTKVFCGFMTRHFTKQLLEIASLYFKEVKQSRGWKKSRILTLSNPKKDTEEIEPLHTIPFLNYRGEHLSFKQYYGVFSSRHIDYATQFLLQHLSVDSTTKRALDLASGNGVIAHEIRAQSKHAEIHLLDDSYLAIESSRLNIKEGDNHFHHDHKLKKFEDEYFDLIVCNPPFHFEYENTIDIALRLFKEVSRILKSNGYFVQVSNLHLNYKTHLSKSFKSVKVIGRNSKYEIIKCQR